MHIAAQSFFFLAHHQNDFGVGLQTEDAVDNMHAGTFQVLGPLNVVVFIEAGLEFHQGHHLLAILSCAD